MSKANSNVETDTILRTVRRVAEGAKQTQAASKSAQPKERLILSQRLRVASRDVLMLEPKHAVGVTRKQRVDAAKAPSDVKDVLLLDEPVVPDAAMAEARSKSRDAKTNTDQTTPLKTATSTRQSAPRKAALGDLDVDDLTAKIAALETAIAKTPDQWEPDGTSPDAYSGTESNAMSWEESVELDAKGEPLTGAAMRTQNAPKETNSAIDEAAVEALVDEEKLREIVALIVRSELRGVLGERITRNVRKLVRREIQQALAMQDRD